MPKQSYRFLLSMVLTALIHFAPQGARAAVRCEDVLTQQLQDVWRDGSPNSFMAFRSNAPHFWAWFKGAFPESMPQNLQIEGAVAGDPHAANFGQVLLKNRKFILQLVDLDDSGKAPLLGDFLRLSISIKESGSSLKYQEMWDAYVDGLNGRENYEAPGFVRKALRQTNAEFLEEQQEMLTGHFEDGEMDFHEYDLKSIFMAPVWVQEAVDELRNQIDDRADGTQILNVGWKTKDDGGSQGMERVWMLLKKDSTYKLVEYKQMAPPATSYFSPQSGHVSRINRTKQKYWGTDKARDYSVTSTEQSDFLVRSRFEYPLNKKISKIMQAQGKKLDKYSLYLAYRLGQIHGEQVSGRNLAENLEHSSVDPQQILKNLANEYRDLLQENLR